MRVAFSFQSFRSLLLATILIGLVLLGAWFVGRSQSPPDLELSRDHDSNSRGDGSLVVRPVGHASAGRFSISSRGETSLETRERVSAVLECLRESDANAMRDCVATAFEGADLGGARTALRAELRTAGELEGVSVCLSACLASLPLDLLPDLLGSLSGACGDGQGIADFLTRELATLRLEDPAIAAELLTNVKSTGPVTMIESRLLGLLAMAGEAACESAAESIALG